MKTKLDIFLTLELETDYNDSGSPQDFVESFQEAMKHLRGNRLIQAAYKWHVLYPDFWTPIDLFDWKEQVKAHEDKEP